MKGLLNFTIFYILLTTMSFGQVIENSFFDETVQRRSNNESKINSVMMLNHLARRVNSYKNFSVEIKQRLDSIIETRIGNYSYTEKTNYIYENSKHVSSIRYRKEGDDLLFSWKEEYDYDRGNTPEKRILYYWNESGQIWENTWKTEYGWNENNLTQIVKYSWSENKGWMIDSKTEIDYSNGNPANEYSYYWSEIENLWINSYWTEFEFDNNVLSEQISYNWNQENESWESDSKMVCEFNENQLLTGFIRYYWNPSQKNWIPFSLYTNAYGNNNELVESVSYDWNNTLEDWELYSKWIPECNITYSYYELLLPFIELDEPLFNYDLRSQMNKMITNISGYIWESNNWQFDWTSELFYSEVIINALDNLEVKTVKIWPNPAQNMIKIHNEVGHEKSTFRLYNISGNEVKFIIITEKTTTLDLTDLPRGMYFYVISNSFSNQKGKLILN